MPNVASGAPERIVVSADAKVVRRPAHRWTPTVHGLLRHLCAAGVATVPEPVGIEGDVELLRYLPGASGSECWPLQADERGLRSAARLLRDVHDATRRWAPPADAEWAVAGWGTGDVEHQVICHGDPGPWNMVWSGFAAVGLIDWDLAHPGSALEDIAYALEYLAPFRSDAHALEWNGFTEAPDRRRRIEVFADAYGLDDTVGLVEAVISRQQLTMEHVQRLAERGEQPQHRWVREGVLDELRSRVAWSRASRSLLG